MTGTTSASPHRSTTKQPGMSLCISVLLSTMLLLGSIRQCSGNVELKAYTEPRFPIIMVPLNSEFVDLGNTAAAQEAAPAEIFARAYDQCNFAGNMVAEITSNDGGLADTSMLPIRSIRVTSGYGVHVFDAMMFEGAAIATVTADDEAAGACFDGVVASVETFMPLLRNDGPIIAQAKIYVVWYGFWSRSDRNIIMDFFVGANESRWFDQMQPYGVTSMSWGGARVDKYSRGRSFPSTYGQDEVRAIVEESFTMGRLPVDPNGIYFVLTSQDVQINGFPSVFCGWHQYTSYQGQQIAFSLVGVPTDGMLRACAFDQLQSGPTPNGNRHVDAMINVVAHEMVETMTDPFFTAWADLNGKECADKCSWNADAASPRQLPSGAWYTTEVRGRPYFLQSIWDPVAHQCTRLAL